MSKKTSHSPVQAQAGGKTGQTDEVSLQEAAASSLLTTKPPQGPSSTVVASSPSLSFSKKLAAKLCDELAKGLTLKAVCASSKTFPPPHIVRQWAQEDINGFASDYARARELGFMTMADELIEIVDQEDGNITRDKLRVDTRKWLLSKAMPKGFGDSPEMKASVKIGLDDTDYEMGIRIAFAIELSSRTGGNSED